MFRKLTLALSVAFLLLLASPSVASAATIWDLATDWSDSANPNGPWAYRQGSNALPALAAGGWGPGTQPGNFLPFWAKASADNVAGYQTGDIIVHSVDGQNGNPSLGEANVAWTSPISGVIDISGFAFYSQFPLGRSNDFTLMLNSTVLATGTVSSTNGYDRSNPLQFAATGVAVSAGDVVQLVFHRTPGQSDGSIAGVGLTITQTVPEPALASLLAAGSLALVGLRSRTTR
jgi:hypothetical protein